MKTSSKRKVARFTNNIELAVRLEENYKDFAVRDIWNIFGVKVRALEITVDESGYKLGKT